MAFRTRNFSKSKCAVLTAQMSPHHLARPGFPRNTAREQTLARPRNLAITGPLFWSGAPGRPAEPAGRFWNLLTMAVPRGYQRRCPKDQTGPLFQSIAPGVTPCAPRLFEGDARHPRRAACRHWNHRRVDRHPAAGAQRRRLPRARRAVPVQPAHDRATVPDLRRGKQGTASLRRL